MGTFIASVFALCGVVSVYYPDKKSVPKQYADGLEAELGGPKAVRVSCFLKHCEVSLLTVVGAEVWRGTFLDQMRCHHACVNNSIGPFFAFECLLDKCC